MTSPEMMRSPSPSHPENKLWYKGVNPTADAVIINTTDRTVLLIKRGDTGAWALPGGFIDSNESSEAAARREAQEETGIMVSGEATLVYEGVVDDPRNSDDAWIETSAYVFIQHEAAVVRGTDDAKEASWVPLHSLPPLYASHGSIMQLALAHVDLGYEYRP